VCPEGNDQENKAIPVKMTTTIKRQTSLNPRETEDMLKDAAAQKKQDDQGLAAALKATPKAKFGKIYSTPDYFITSTTTGELGVCVKKGIKMADAVNGIAHQFKHFSQRMQDLSTKEDDTIDKYKKLLSYKTKHDYYLARLQEPGGELEALKAGVQAVMAVEPKRVLLPSVISCYVEQSGKFVPEREKCLADTLISSHDFIGNFSDDREYNYKRRYDIEYDAELKSARGFFTGLKQLLTNTKQSREESKTFAEAMAKGLHEAAAGETAPKHRKSGKPADLTAEIAAADAKVVAVNASIDRLTKQIADVDGYLAQIDQLSMIQAE
jgi:hypothetical protein